MPEQAVVIDNLSIVMTAKELNPDLFTVARQENPQNDELFDSSGADLVARRSLIVARRILAMATIPLLPVFIERAGEWHVGREPADVCLAAAADGSAPRHEARRDRTAAAAIRVDELVEQGAGAVVADEREVGVDEQRVGSREPPPPHGIAGTDDQQAGRQRARDVAQRGQGPAQQG